MPGPVFARGERVDLHIVETEGVPFLQRLVDPPDINNCLLLFIYWF